MQSSACPSVAPEPGSAFEVKLTGGARRALRSIPPRIVPAIIEFAVGDLAREPRRVGKPLERELAGLHAARRGPYRVIYRIDDAEHVVHIIHVNHRADDYRAR